jgi:AraC-like DNA-binding protein
MPEKADNHSAQRLAARSYMLSEHDAGFSVALSSALPLMDLLRSHGISESHLLERYASLTGSLVQPDVRLSVRAYQALWQEAIALTGNPALGLSLAQEQDCRGMGLVGHVVFNSETMRHGLAHYIRLFRIINDALLLYLEEDDAQAQLVFVHQCAEFYCMADIERSFVLAARRCEYWLGVHQPFTAVHFQHPAPVYAAQYRKVFQCPVYFNQPDCKIIFERQALDLPPRHRNPTLREAALQYANRLLDDIRQSQLSERVRRLLERDMSQTEPDIRRVAGQLNMSPQTLYKKLKAEGQVFQKLVESVRLNKALQLLSHSAISTTEIAYILGFSELSAFSRAFKRWTGMSPRAYRITALNGQA